ncbi:hypothetical protein CDD83_860 [Cordyceps sp. RAO-2017]|nr:hypothetical protein CDD83_860 [Cordyceps sp. RAO-2017]
MAPSTQELETALIDGTCQVYSTEPDAISVNKVRRHVEQKLGLDEDFFAGDEWKHKSKTVIKKYVDKLLDGWTPETDKPGPDANADAGASHPSSEVESPQPKRRKRPSQAKKPVKKEESGAGKTEKKPAKAKKAAARRKPKAVKSDEEGSPPNSPASNRKRKREAKEESADESKDLVKRDGSEDQGLQATSVEVRPGSVDGEDKKPDSEDADQPVDGGETKAAIENEEEEYSDVIDEAPKPKRKSTDKKESSKAPKAAPKKAASSTADDSTEAEIKKLQSHLVKCGIRKLWHNELKKYGGDGRAKIRHLRKMLADVGMDGRFSEAKAREIKETRELMAEAEAAQAMNRLWGMNSGGRASRSKSKSTRLDESEGSGADAKQGTAGGDKEGGDDDDDEEDNTFAARRRRAQADLAFLGDDSDSD